MDYQKQTIPNGLKLLTIPMVGAQSVTVLLMVAVGSRYEEERINGISHFLEHMAFKGTHKRPTALAISSLIDGIGGEFNAFTSKDHTGYYIKAAKKHLPLLVDILSDMLLHSKFDQVEIDKERGVIIEEINMYEDTPMRKVGDLYENLLYGDTPLGRDISGKKEVIKKVTRDDFLSFMDTYYGPKNTIMTIAGGVDEALGTSNQALVKEVVEEHLGAWKIGNAPEPEGIKDGQKGPQVLVKYKDTQQAHLCIGVPSYPLGHKDRYALGVLTAILGGGMSSRLFIEVRERRGLAYYVRSGNEQYSDVGNFVTQAGVDVIRIDDAIKVMLSEFATIRDNTVTSEELNKAKEFLKGRFILELEDSRSVASVYVMGELLEGKIRTPEEILTDLEKVTAEDVSRVAKDIFREQVLNLAVIGPYKSEERFKKILQLG